MWTCVSYRVIYFVLFCFALLFCLKWISEWKVGYATEPIYYLHHLLFYRSFGFSFRFVSWIHFNSLNWIEECTNGRKCKMWNGLACLWKYSILCDSVYRISDWIWNAKKGHTLIEAKEIIKQQKYSIESTFTM